MNHLFILQVPQLAQRCREEVLSKQVELAELEKIIKGFIVKILIVEIQYYIQGGCVRMMHPLFRS